MEFCQILLYNYINSNGGFMVQKNSNAANNETLMLGVGILIIGLILGVYSLSTYVEIKNLSEKVDLDLIDANTKLTPSDKYLEYYSIAEFLNKKLKQNRNIPVKNAACVYLNYAHENAILMYNIADKKLDYDISKKNDAAANIRSLYKIYDDYKGCRQTAGLKEELGKYIADIEGASKLNDDSDERMNNFLNGYREKKQAEEAEFYEQNNIIKPEEMTEEQKHQLEQDMNNVQQWQTQPEQPQERKHVLVPLDDNAD